MKKNYSSVLILVTLCSILLYSFLNANDIVVVILDYTELFVKKLFPISFLFFILSSLLMDYQLNQIIQRTFKLNSVYFYYFFISLLSGFPAGAFLIKEGLERGIIDLDDANKIIKYAHFPNPLFVLSSVSIVTGNKNYALYVLVAIIMSNFIIFIFIRKSRKTYLELINFPKDFSSCLKTAVNKAIKVIVLIYGTSLFFYLIAFILSSFFTNPYFYVFINGLFDLTKGVYTTPIISNVFFRVIFIIFFIAFGSLSIHFQVKSILVDTSVSYKNYLLGRIISFILSVLIFFLLWKFFHL